MTSTAWNSVRVLLGLLPMACSPVLATSAPLGAQNGRVLSRTHSPGLRVVHGAAAQPTAITPAPRLDDAKTYVVKTGDTLWSIARRNGTTVDRVLALNTITDAGRVRTGSRLMLPTAEVKIGMGNREPEIATDALPQSVESKKSMAVSAPEPSPPKTAAMSRGYLMTWPVDGILTSRFGQREGKAHDGVDVSASVGTPIRAAAEGTVVFAGEHAGYGKLTLVAHPGGLISVYAHQQTQLVRKGQLVKARQVIGMVGLTGRTTGPHLHFEVRRGVVPVNPLQFLPP